MLNFIESIVKLALVSCLISCSQGNRYSLDFANDLLKPTKNNDRDFTHGTKFSADVPNSEGSATYAIGQNIYTPDNKQLTTPQPSKRPYAGWLYGEYDRHHIVTPDVQDSFGIIGGIVGPGSLAEQSQNGIHRLLGQKTAKGWNNQLHNEPGVILNAQREWAKHVTQNFDYKLEAGAEAGNVFTQALGGVRCRVGYNLPSQFDNVDIIYPRRTFGVSTVSAFLYSGLYGRLVARNIFLDGNTFRDSQSVDKYPAVAEYRLGAVLEYQAYRAAYTYIIHTKEFTTDTWGNDFGEITLSVGW